MFRRLLILVTVFSLVVPRARADDTIRAVQEALRVRKLYFGDVDGATSPATVQAIRRFQEKKGFDPTGLLSPPTLRALGIPTQSPGSDRLDQARDFIARFLHAGDSNRLAQIMAFYAERVDYMDDGFIHRDAIQSILTTYYETWPTRHSTLLHCVASLSPADPSEIIVTFRYQFDVRSPAHEQKGAEDLNTTLRPAGNDLQIVAIKEF
jgi:hypothetical protein